MPHLSHMSQYKHKVKKKHTQSIFHITHLEYTVCSANLFLNTDCNCSRVCKLKIAKFTCTEVYTELIHFEDVRWKNCFHFENAFECISRPTETDREIRTENL